MLDFMGFDLFLCLKTDTDVIEIVVRICIMYIMERKDHIYILHELKDHIGCTLAKEKDIGETMAFAVDKRASLTDVKA